MGEVKAKLLSVTVLYITLCIIIYGLYLQSQDTGVYQMSADLDKLYDNLTLRSFKLEVQHSQPAQQSIEEDNKNFLEKEVLESGLKEVNPYRFKFIVGVESCEDDVDLLVVVHSSPKPAYTERRTLLRSTWLKKKFLEEMLQMKIRIIFFMGKADNSTDQLHVEQESRQYGDIVQSDFQDSYQNNTYKAMSYLLWTSMYCSNASLLMKIDDDVLLKTESCAPLRDKMKSWIKGNESVYIGKPGGTGVHRNPKDQWYISRDIWPADKYPLWFQGLVYFLSPRSTADLFQAALQTVYMHTDDVFVGILVTKVPSITNKIAMKNYLSEGTPNSKDIERDLTKYWQKGDIPIFHIPDLKVYREWSSMDLNE